MARRMRTIVVCGGLALAAGACAPVTFAPDGFGVALHRGGFTLTQCAPLGGSAEAARVGIRNAAIDAGAFQSRAAHLQQRLMLGSSALLPNETWKRLAAGEC
jgi:hypothetical protein